jgi:hypothetical protein
MAGDWIKMRCNLDTDPAVFQMAAALEMDELAVVGRLWKVWTWADQHVSDCHAISVTCSVLDRITTTPGFAEAMRKVGWLEGRDGVLSFPRFDRHNGQTAKNRALATNRQAKKRHDYVTLSSLHERDQRREEKSIDETVSAECGFCVDEVIEAGRRSSIPEDVCRAYHDDREGAGWLDGKGRPVKSMPHDLSGFWRKWQSNRSPKQFGNGTVASNGNPKPGEGVWHLEKRIGAAQAEISALQGDPNNKEPVNPDTPWDRRLKPDVAKRISELKTGIAAMRRQLAGGEGVAA